MLRAVALPFDSEKRAIGDRLNLPFPSFRASDEQRFGALFANLLLPGEGEARQGRDVCSQEVCSLPLLLPEQAVDRYGALFLSSSYSSKIVSTNSCVIITPARRQRSTMSSRQTFGS